MGRRDRSSAFMLIPQSLRDSPLCKKGLRWIVFNRIKKKDAHPGAKTQMNVFVQYGEDTPPRPLCQEYVLMMFSAARRLVMR